MSTLADSLPDTLPRDVIETMIIQRAVNDGDYWNLLISDPMQALEELFGTAPTSLTVETKVEDANTFYFIVPYADYVTTDVTVAPNVISPRAGLESQINYLLTDSTFQAAFADDPNQAVADALNTDFVALGVDIVPLYEDEETLYIVLPYSAHSALCIGPYSAEFNGTDSTITVPYADAIAVDDLMTVEVWFQVPEFRAGQRDTLLSMSDDGGGWAISVSDRKPSIRVNIDGTVVTAQSDNSILVANKWHYLVGIVDGLEVVLYVDGRIVASETAVGSVSPASSTTDLTMGGDGLASAECYLQGMIHEVRLWGDILHPSIVRANVTARTTVDDLPESTQQTLLAHYLFSEGSGTRLGDASPFANNGTLNNVVWQITGLDSPA